MKKLLIILACGWATVAASAPVFPLAKHIVVDEAGYTKLAPDTNTVQSLADYLEDSWPSNTTGGLVGFSDMTNRDVGVANAAALTSTNLVAGATNDLNTVIRTWTTNTAVNIVTNLSLTYAVGTTQTVDNLGLDGLVFDSRYDLPVAYSMYAEKAASDVAGQVTYTQTVIGATSAKIINFLGHSEGPATNDFNATTGVFGPVTYPGYYLFSAGGHLWNDYFTYQWLALSLYIWEDGTPGSGSSLDVPVIGGMLSQKNQADRLWGNGSVILEMDANDVATLYFTAGTVAGATGSVMECWFSAAYLGKVR